MDKNSVSLSKFISLILRADPGVIGITLDEHGWAKVTELVEGIAATRPFTQEMLEYIVENDSKQRYSFNGDKTLIRANQGHSVPVDVELEAAVPPEYLWHGTAVRNVPSIDREGIKAMSRLYVHLSPDEITAYKVGARHGRPFIYKIRSREMYEAGYAFYRSVNGVWLTKEVPAEYLEKGKMRGRK
ncbi:MAG: RNA 2'-phosphotransferase [Lachnospiraceae bacterium]|nr:RNA 2'-phosphotransferase [Lachnospiraceae bacterium]